MSKTFKIVLILLIVASVVSAAIAVIGFMGKEREYMKRLVVEDKLALTLKEKRNLEKDLETAKSAKEQSEVKIEKIEEKMKSVGAELDALKLKSETSAEELEVKKTELVKAKTDLESERKEKLSISKQLETIQTDYSKVKKQLTALTSEKMDLEKRIQELQEKQSVSLDKIVVNPEESAPVSKPLSVFTSSLQGKVLVVNKEYGFIVTDIGQDRGIQKGAKFDVMDGPKQIGRVEIDKVYDTMSSATVLSGSKINDMKKGNTIVESR